MIYNNNMSINFGKYKQIIIFFLIIGGIFFLFNKFAKDANLDNVIISDNTSSISSIESLAGVELDVTFLAELESRINTGLSLTISESVPSELVGRTNPFSGTGTTSTTPISNSADAEPREVLELEI